MASMKDEVRSEYQDLRDRFRGTSYEDFRRGEWFATFVRWLLENYAKQVDAEYIRRKYPGVAPANQAKKAISLASKYNGIAGGLSASAITALQLSSLGPQAAITIPAAASAVLADVAFSTRTQLRSAYDLSVIHRAPLAVDDVEDCYLVFLVAMGAKLHEMGGGIGKTIGPRVVAYNMRKLLRSGLRGILQETLERIGGTWLARKLTERAMMRLLVPGVSVPISSGFNYYFTKKVLTTANATMYRRGRVVQPLVRLYKRSEELDKTAGVKVLISVVETGDADGWAEEQMNSLRQCQQASSLTDDDLANLENYMDRNIDQVLGELPKLSDDAASELVEFVTVVAAEYPTDRYDDQYAEAIGKLRTWSGLGGTVPETKKTLVDYRKKLL